MAYRSSMRSRPAITALALAATLSLSALAWAATHSSPGVEVEASGSVKEVLGRLQKMVGDNGMMVMGELHQGNVLAMTGLKVESESIFVGSPTVGKELFSADPAAGLVVPIRINIYARADGQTVVSYIPPSRLLGEFRNPKIDQIAANLDKTLQMLTGMLGR